MAKKTKSKKEFNKKLLLISVLLIAFFAVWALMNPSLFTNLNKTSSKALPTDEPREVVTVYLKNGKKTDAIVGRKNDEFLYANVDYGNYGNWNVLKIIDGKWTVVGDAQQVYPCTYFQGLGMTNQDINDLGILSRNGGCLPDPSEDEIKNWNPDPTNFTSQP